MGNCLPKPRKEKKKKSSRKKKTDEYRGTHEVLSRASDFKKVKKNEPADMVNALNKTKRLDASSEETSKKIYTRKDTPRPTGSKSRTKTSNKKKDAPVAKDVEDRSRKLECVSDDPSSEITSGTITKDTSDTDTDKIIAEILEEDEVNLKPKVKPKHSLTSDVGKDVIEDNTSMPARVQDKSEISAEKITETVFEEELENLMDEILEEEETKLDKKVNARQAVSFTVEIDDGDNIKPTSSIPARLAERLAAPSEKKSEFDYTEEEEQLMAEILRDDNLNERKEKAQHENIKIYDAKRKKTCLEKSRECQMKQKLNSTTGDKKENRMRVKRLAEADRRKAFDNKEAEDGGQ